MNIKKLIFALFLVFTLFLVGCTAGQVDLSKLSDNDIQRISSQIIACNDPYIRYGTGCCIDQNKNKICDSDEQQKPMEVQNKSIANNQTKKETTKTPSTNLPAKQQQETLINNEKLSVYDFADFPIFINNNWQIVVSDTTGTSALINLTKLNDEKLGSINDNLLTSEISNKLYKNTVIIGECDNSIIKSLFEDLDSECNIAQNKAYIILQEYNGKEVLLITGGTPKLTSIAVLVLRQNEDYKLSGKVIEIEITDKGNIKVTRLQ